MRTEGEARSVPAFTSFQTLQKWRVRRAKQSSVHLLLTAKGDSLLDPRLTHIMNQTTNGATKPPPLDPSERLRVYELLWAKLNQEGDGIWSRFNIILALHVALFGGFAFFFTHDPPHRLWRAFSGGIAGLGVLASIWALAVLKGLWVWHRHWKRQLVEFEKQLCEKDGWLKPHTTLPAELPFWRGAPGATQPVFFVLLVVWSALLGVAIAYGR